MKMHASKDKRKEVTKQKFAKKENTKSYAENEKRENKRYVKKESNILRKSSKEKKQEKKC